LGRSGCAGGTGRARRGAAAGVRERGGHAAVRIGMRSMDRIDRLAMRACRAALQRGERGRTARRARPTLRHGGIEGRDHHVGHVRNPRVVGHVAQRQRVPPLPAARPSGRAHASPRPSRHMVDSGHACPLRRSGRAGSLCCGQQGPYSAPGSVTTHHRPAVKSTTKDRCAFPMYLWREAR